MTCRTWVINSTYNLEFHSVLAVVFVEGFEDLLIFEQQSQLLFHSPETFQIH